ncbi:MAG: dipeptide epimerase [Anaerolineae bacterium]|uniref:dipeptide epimerase n=1 Tax=Promineifilum sp. TaxID=2664178 RepID=UPI001DBF004B|nr:dipeptide epimerase [Anaerolineales bacterium]MCB8934510.1 dipeptide epimerase [Promineifilum sp.]MCO5179920.1 dipeptide epimerase [Promineifilum sp.]MCW5847080.1 dipeptide epimerase [Anaerolineae bacterium]
MIRLTWEPITLQLRNPFRISHGTSDTRTAHWLRLSADEGWGEGTIPPYYGIAATDMAAWWNAAARRTDPFPEDPADIPTYVGADGPAPARAALDLALHDRLGRLHAQPLYGLLGLPAPQPLPTSFTLAIDEPEAMGRSAAALTGCSVIKLKLGGNDGLDVARVAAVRAARPDVTLYVDANAGWTADEAIGQIDRMMAHGVALVEQPVAKADFEGMGRVQAHSPVPVVADESVQTLADVEQLAAAGVGGINLKLMKVGGLGPGLAILRRARELGLGIMLGCMVETSIGATAMAHLMGLADWLDLDAPWLVANDPFDGLTYDDDGHVHIPARPGIGVARRSSPGA